MKNNNKEKKSAPVENDTFSPGKRKSGFWKNFLAGFAVSAAFELILLPFETVGVFFGWLGIGTALAAVSAGIGAHKNKIEKQTTLSNNRLSEDPPAPGNSIDPFSLSTPVTPCLSPSTARGTIASRRK